MRIKRKLEKEVRVRGRERDGVEREKRRRVFGAKIKEREEELVRGFVGIHRFKVRVFLTIVMG